MGCVGGGSGSAGGLFRAAVLAGRGSGYALSAARSTFFRAVGGFWQWDITRYEFVGGHHVISFVEVLNGARAMRAGL